MESRAICVLFTLSACLAGVYGVLECPAVPAGGAGICSEDCAPGDGSCSSGQLCCSTGCGHGCMDAAKPVLYCPAPPKDVEGICSQECQKGDCAGNQLCCSNGCGHSCTSGVQLMCPAPGAGGVCSEDCPVDGCPGGELCCSNGCGHVCMVGEVSASITSNTEPEPEDAGSSIKYNVITAVFMLLCAKFFGV